MRSVLPGIELAVGAPLTVIGLWIVFVQESQTGPKIEGIAVLFAGLVLTVAAIAGLIWMRSVSRRRADDDRTL